MKRRILLADDSVTIQKVIELTFMDEDYEVRAVSNGDEAVALLSEMAPDFVIADVHMPGANGYEVCRRAKQLRPGTPVLLLVGTFEPFDEAQARSVGADSFLKKPFDSQELLQRVEELIAAKAPVISPPTIPMPIVPLTPPAAAPEPFGADWGTGASSGLGDGLGFAAPEPPPAPAPAAAPDWNAAPWGGFELASEPEPMAAPVPRGAEPEPFDREPSFTLEPEPDYTPPEAEPVFSLEETDSSFSIREDVFGAPSDLSLDEAPQDRYIPDALEEPAVPASAGFSWNEEPEPIRFAEEAPVAAAPEFAPEPSWSEPLEPLQTFEEEAAPEPEQPQWSLPEPAYPPAAGQPQYEPSPAAYAAPAAVASTAAVAPVNGNGHLSDDDVDRIARRVVELLGDRTVRDVAWEVIPDMAEVIIRDRLRELEGQVE